MQEAPLRGSNFTVFTRQQPRLSNSDTVAEILNLEMENIDTQSKRDFVWYLLIYKN